MPSLTDEILVGKWNCWPWTFEEVYHIERLPWTDHNEGHRVRWSWQVFWSFYYPAWRIGKIGFGDVCVDGGGWSDGALWYCASWNDQEEQEHKVCVNEERRAFVLVWGMAKTPKMVPQTCFWVHQLCLEGYWPQSLLRNNWVKAKQ